MTQQEANQALVFAYDYRPLVSFDVVTRLQQSVVDDVLGREFDDEPVVDDTNDYNAYVILYSANDDPGEYAIVFTENTSLSTDASYEFDTDAVYFSTDANLLEAGLSGGDGDGDDETPTPEEDETPTPEEGTPTPEEGTPTPEEGTPTPEEGTPTPEPGGGEGGGTPTPGGGGG